MGDLEIRFGRLVTVHRKNRAMSREQLASLTGLSFSMISRIEGGKTGARFPTIQKLANALKVDPAELFTWETNIALQAGNLPGLASKLAKLTPKRLAWVEGIIDAALKAA